MRLLNADNKEIEDCPIKPDRLAGMIKMIEGGVISIKIAKTVFEEMYTSGKDAETIVKEQGLVQVSDTGAIESIIDEVIKANPGTARRLQGRQGEALRIFRGPGDEGEQGQGEPGYGEPAAEEEIERMKTIHRITGSKINN